MHQQEVGVLDDFTIEKDRKSRRSDADQHVERIYQCNRQRFVDQHVPDYSAAHRSNNRKKNNAVVVQLLVDCNKSSGHCKCDCSYEFHY
jgi:hypothetical protein